MQLVYGGPPNAIGTATRTRQLPEKTRHITGDSRGRGSVGTSGGNSGTAWAGSASMIMDVLETMLFSTETPMLTVAAAAPAAAAAAAAAAVQSCNEIDDVSGMEFND